MPPCFGPLVRSASTPLPLLCPPLSRLHLWRGGGAEPPRLPFSCVCCHPFTPANFIPPSAAQWRECFFSQAPPAQPVVVFVVRCRPSPTVFRTLPCAAYQSSSPFPVPRIGLNPPDGFLGGLVFSQLTSRLPACLPLSSLVRLTREHATNPASHADTASRHTKLFCLSPEFFSPFQHLRIQPTQLGTSSVHTTRNTTRAIQHTQRPGEEGAGGGSEGGSRHGATQSNNLASGCLAAATDPTLPMPLCRAAATPAASPPGLGTVERLPAVQHPARPPALDRPPGGCPAGSGGWVGGWVFE